MNSEYQSVEPDIPDEDGSWKENDQLLRPVLAGESGEGLPYAPIDWPNPGDVWGWKVGKRKSNSGFMLDRYLYLPSRLQKSLHGKQSFASKHSVKEYIRKEFPNADIDAFFASFSWKVPSRYHCWQKESTALSSTHPKEEMAEHSGSESDVGTMDCKARNKMCSLRFQATSYSLPAMNCDICCSEIGFCRNCCCILCCRTIDLAYGGYSFIRCEARLNENYICGHIAHVDCALRSYMAGTVGGSIGLDVEYYCRRCDQRTDLISHVARLLQTCESLDSREDIEKILKVGLCILRGSQQESAKRLLNRIELALTKLKSGIYLEEIWKVEDNFSVASAGELSPNNQDLHDLTAPDEVSNIQRRSQQPVYITSDHRIESLKLMDEIDKVLQDLRKSQDIEYTIAEERLYAQKDFLVGLYQQLDSERSELAKRTSSTMDCDIDALLTNVLNRVNQIKQEVVKLKDMEEVAKGFGRTPRGILREHFGLQIEDRN